MQLSNACVFRYVIIRQFSSTCIYSGTSIKRTPLGLGNSLLAIIERWSLPWEVSIASYVCSTSHFLLQINLGALLTASLAHTSFEKAVGTSYS